ncbi:HAD family hydrolase [Acinetobacter nosocomialis]|uniref:HAD family hydrolase n=1 Tax=Acinetobacter nosocomialis TaxID=106654 RepID=UPI000DE6DDDA|nr:HAD family hydrolase [Acinetobacter nosocomialis]MBP1476885.1 HAD family hydrolase [Acinetobacter nosocomialis]MBP1512395.1 HAD family hydrolase [Acinetobacter nosocomialis]SSV40800.1 L-2-haloalkanoic acid dehalogenase [Acinetobacter nosocomialis]
MKKVLLFDLDQTILNRNESLIKFLNWQVNFFKLVPQELKESFIKSFIKLDNNGSVWKDIVYDQLIKDFNIKGYDTNELLQSYINNFNKFSTAFENAQKTIQNLHAQGYTLGLVSNGKTPFQEHNFYALGITDYFSTIVISEAIGLRKPDPAIYLYACTQLGCKPSDCIFIGDNPKADIEGAKKVGMQTIFFHPTLTLKHPLSDASIHHYDELEETIKRLVTNPLY